MIKIKFSEIESIIISLKTLTSKELPLKTAYTLKKLMKQLYPEYEIFQEQRKELINKYGEKDEKNNLIYKNNSITIKPDFIKEAHKKFDELLQIEFEIDFFPISIEILGDINISPKDLFNLDQFIID